MEVKKILEPGLEFFQNPNYPVDDPRYGLERFKPFDKDTKNFSKVSVVVVGPSKFEKPFRSFWKNLVEGISNTQQGDQSYKKGFEDFLQVDITKDDELEYYGIDKYAGNIQRKYELALEECKRKKDKEAMIVVIQPEDENEFNFRNELKLKLIQEKSQFVKPQTILRQEFLGSVLNNFAVGVYSKYGGTPWRLKDPRFANTLVLGISFHYVRPTRFDAPERTIFGFSEIVDEYGHHVGMTVNPLTLKTKEFKDLYQHKSLFIPQKQIQTLIENSIAKYKQRTNDFSPSKIIIHKTSFYHAQELKGIKEGLKKAGFKGEYALVHLQNETGYRMYRENDYRSMRGILLKPEPKNPYGVLWTLGRIPSQFWDKTEGKMKYFEKSGVKIGTASPIGILIHKDSNMKEMDFDYVAELTLALTKMRWNTVEPGLREPVSTYFARNGGRFVASIWNQHNKEIDVLMENLDARFLL